MDKNTRLVIITNGNYFARLILDGVLNKYSECISGILVITGDYKARTGFRALWAIGKSTAFPYLIYKIFTYIAFDIAQHWFPDAIFSVERQAVQKGIPFFQVISVNSSQARSWVASCKPDLLVSVSCPQLIRREMLSLARDGGINIHSSLLPSYAGLAPYYWVLSQGEKRTGTTMHYLTLKFDEGNILAQEQIDIRPNESAFQLFYRLANLGSIALEVAVQRAVDKEQGVTQDLSSYTYYSHPSFKSYVGLRRSGHRLIRVGELLKIITNEIKLSRTKQNYTESSSTQALPMG